MMADMLERWREMRRQVKIRASILIQKIFRGFLARRQAKSMLLEVEGRRLYAARIIMRAIIRYQHGKKFHKLQEKWRVSQHVMVLPLYVGSGLIISIINLLQQVEQSAALLMELAQEKDEVIDDIEDIDIDVKQLQRYIKRFSWRVKEL